MRLAPNIALQPTSPATPPPRLSFETLGAARIAIVVLGALVCGCSAQVARERPPAEDKTIQEAAFRWLIAENDAMPHQGDASGQPWIYCLAVSRTARDVGLPPEHAEMQRFAAESRVTSVMSQK